MKRILYIMSTLKKSGPMIVLANTVKYLNRNKFEPMILTLSPETSDSMKNYFQDELNTKTFTLGLSRIQGLFLAKREIQKFIKENQIDLVHTHGFRADGLMSKIDDVVSVSTLHNYPYYDYMMRYGNLRGLIMANFHLSYIKKITEPIACSKSVSNIFENEKQYKINFIQNGTDTQRFQNFNKDSLRKRINIDKNRTTFISVGHLASGKDPLTVIKAFQKANIDNTELIFLGDGHLLENCKSMVKNNQNIKFAGKVNNVEEYLGASDYLISASLAEGLPNTVLEAMACGLPCILSNIPPHEEIHEIDTNSSLLFDIKDIDKLSNLINEIQTKDYKIMSDASKSIIYNNLSAEIMSENYQAVYSKLLK